MSNDDIFILMMTTTSDLSKKFIICFYFGGTFRLIICLRCKKIFVRPCAARVEILVNVESSSRITWFTNSEFSLHINVQLFYD